ncbi:MAG: Gfo/Idh/MocA family oxidoreductase [Candidatus Kapabacteria bacterium]|nr:Gfo/Idh/MocA family oxidoreductase [Ignavibacteriota bacterium]MCW5883738.1 Gfo/Idh/MocA family oxidoreductase [Candidatus Kapabacteria bacterium]
MSTVNIGVIGAGEVAQNFHLPIHHRLPNVNLFAIYDRNKSKAGLIAEKYGIPHVCNSVEEMLLLDGLHAVDICTSTDAHAETAISAIEAGKHTLIEKPVARNYKEAISIKEAADKTDLKVMVATNQRFRYDAKMLKSYVQNGDIGNIFYVQGSWLQQKRSSEWKQQIEKSGGGVLIDLGISLIDSLMWICDFPEIKSVSANTFSHLTKKVEDVCVANIKFQNGSIATMEMSWSLFSSRNSFAFNVYGSKGAAKINPVKLYKVSGDVYQPVTNTDLHSNLEIFRKSFESEIKHFINSVQGFSPVVSTVSEAVIIMKIIDAMYKSSILGTEVELD